MGTALATVAYLGMMSYLLSLLYRMTLTEEELGRELMGENVQQKELIRVFLSDVQAIRSLLSRRR